ncbi:unnamed protein product, partial [Amoebophrya sp. A120]|eukprot:GSA120T00006512001.1
MMRNFSSVLPSILVGSTPVHADHILALEEDYAVELVITLTQECPLPRGWFVETEVIPHVDDATEVDEEASTARSTAFSGEAALGLTLQGVGTAEAKFVPAAR